jgi:protein O-mannosyl-transferase
LSAAPIPTLERKPSRHSAHLESLCEWFLRPAVLIRTVLYLTALLYLRTIAFDYVYDDSFLILTNPWMESWKQVPQFFTHSFWAFLEIPRAIDFYRPLVMVVFASIYHLLGPTPGWFHLVTASIHVLATYLVYRLVCETVGDKTLGAIAAGIFGLHPTKVETAAWISGLSDSLCVVFFLGSMIWYFAAKKHDVHRRRYIGISVVLLVLALFSKEAAIFAPVLIAIYEFSARSGNFRERCRETLHCIWPFGTVTLLAITIRMMVVHYATGSSLNKIPPITTFYTAPRAILWYLSQQLWPFDLSVQYPVMLVKRFVLVEFVLPPLVLLLLCSLVVFAVRAAPIGIFFSSWFVIMLAPVILYHVILQEHDRYSYLASVATSIGLAYVIAHLRRLGTPLQATTIFVLFAAMAALTFNYESYWDNDIKLFTRAVRIAPDNPNAVQYLASVYINQGKPDKAEALAQALLRDPDMSPVGWYLLGSVRVAQKDYESARQAMENSFRLSHGKDLASTLALGGVNVHLNNNEEALKFYRKVLETFPEMAYIHGQMALVLRNMGRTDEAAREAELQRRFTR